LKKKGETDLGGFEIGGLIWAPGNLLYNEGNYGFASPIEDGDDWYYNWLKPVGNGYAPGSNEQMIPFKDDRDPCRKVSSEWRMPTKGEYEELIAAPGADTGHENTYDGAQGIFYGSSNLPEILQNPDEYLFFIGKKNSTFWYWTSTSLNNSNAASVMFGAYNKPTGVYGSDQAKQSLKIRCVRDAS